MEKNSGALTRSGLADAIQSEFEVNKFDALELVEAVLEEIEAALINGDTVKISGFGMFSVRHKNERVGRNPKTLEKAVISSRNSLSFRASPIFKAIINNEETIDQQEKE